MLSHPRTMPPDVFKFPLIEIEILLCVWEEFGDRVKAAQRRRNVT